MAKKYAIGAILPLFRCHLKLPYRIYSQRGIDIVGSLTTQSTQALPRCSSRQRIVELCIERRPGAAVTGAVVGADQ